MNLLYIGNKSAAEKAYPTVLDELAPLFGEFIHVTSISNKKGYVAKSWDMLASIIKDASKTDVVLIETFSTNNFYYAFVLSQLSRILRIPYINFLHGGNLPSRLQGNPKLSRRIFKNAFALVSPSEYLRSEFKKFGYKPILIPNILRLENYRFQERAFDKIELLWVRSFRFHYNPKMAVYALKDLHNQGYSAKLTMVGPDGGDASYEEVLELVKDLGLTDFVFIMGLMEKEKWIELSQKCNIFINTTTIDNTPVSVIEAMALGLPVVSTNVGGIPYLLKDNYDALLVENNNSKAMSAAIVKLFNEKEMAKNLAFNARKKAESFDWKFVKPKWQKLFNEIKDNKQK